MSDAATVRHEHRWGALLSRKGKPFRFCINGYCSMGRYEKNHKVIVARPERRL